MNMVESINETLKDFESLVSNIDFTNYNPNNTDFINAVLVGTMYNLLKQINSESIQTVALEQTNNSDIGEEISGAKKYLQKYFDTNDKMFKEIANDELTHAEYLIKKQYAKLPNSEMRETLKGYESTIAQIKEQM